VYTRRTTTINGERATVIPVADRKRFFASTVRTARGLLPTDLTRFQHHGTFNLMKIWYGYHRIHFEVVLDQQINRIEIGLHFEDGPASTLAYLDLFDRQILEIKETLGHQTELERWTQSWGRIYELWPLENLTAEVGDRTGERLALYIRTLWPVVASSGIVHLREDESR